MLQRFVIPFLLLTGALLTSPTALAQNSAHGHWVTDPRNIATPGFVYDVPPSNFNSLTASDAELQEWGFPPRPGAGMAADYNRWTRMVTATRVIPQLVPTDISLGPARQVKTGGAVGSAIAATSENWSGYAITQKPGTFYSVNDSYVFGEWTVPSVSPPPGFSCGSAHFYAAEWVGFDGYGSNDVMQAGTETNCGNSDYAWYEWYPYLQTKISSPTVSPGNFIEVEVWYTTSSPHGNFWLWNETTGAVAGLGFSAPSGTTLSGNSMEWVVERPTLNGVYTDLVNYGSMTFEGNRGDVPGFNGFSPNGNYMGTDAGTSNWT